MPAVPTPAEGARAPVDRATWSKPWAQLKFVTFQPHIFPRMLGAVSPGAQPGDLVAVYDKQGARVGAGLYNPRAKIPLRVVCHSAEAAGEAYFEAAIDRAVGLRRDGLKLDADTDAWRVINSDGDGLSGLTVDRYGDVLFCEVARIDLCSAVAQCWVALESLRC